MSESAAETDRRTVLVDSDGFRWVRNQHGTYDQIPVPGVYRLHDWTREQVEMVWGTVFEVLEPVEAA